MKKTLYLAGGCFWGIERYFSQLFGVLDTEVGYANGTITRPTYEQINHTGHAETVKIIYDSKVISLNYILDLFYEIIDPTSFQKQGNDQGSQYRTGIYYIDSMDKNIILKSIQELQKRYSKKIEIEVLPLKNYFRAEEYHQDYLNKNALGYCHIPSQSIDEIKKIKIDPYFYQKETKQDLKMKLTPLSYEVTQNNTTEPPYHNSYNNFFEKGIYVDITTGEPLFLSDDKFESQCGWPAFSKPIDERVVFKKEDRTYNQKRIEVKSRVGEAHLGHVFDDGPSELGGLRYCINSASLKFIPYQDMEKEGYGQFIKLFKDI